MSENGITLDRRNDRVYEELSRLNNELVNAQRELAQNNARLSERAADLEQRVADRTRDLRHSLEELETITYSIAHELRSPARHVEAFASLLESSPAMTLPEREREWLAMLRAAAIRQAELIDALIGYLRLGSVPLALRPIDMNAEVASVVAELKAEHPDRRIDWKVANLPAANGDPVLVHEILRSLIGNAVKFTAREPAAAIEVGAGSVEGKVAFFVRDNGAGFDPERAGKLFKPFFRLHLDSDFPGLGIGLATAKRLARRMGGRAWAEAAPNEGATFHFTLDPS